MKTFVGEGQGSISAALEKATAGLTNPSGIIFYAPYEEIGEAAAYLQQKYPGVTTIGTIGTKFVNGSIGDKNVAVTAFFQDAKIGGGIVKELDACPIASIAEITEQLKAVQPGNEDTVCIEFCTNDEERLVTTMNAAFGSRNISKLNGTFGSISTPLNSPLLNSTVIALDVFVAVPTVGSEASSFNVKSKLPAIALLAVTVTE